MATPIHMIDQGEPETLDQSEGFARVYATTLSLKVDGGVQSTVVFKILIRQQDDSLEAVRFQISKEDEIDYLYESSCNVSGFDTLRDEQRFEFEFGDFPNVIRQVLATVEKQDGDDDRYKVVFRSPEPVDEEEAAAGESDVIVLTIWERLEFRKVPIVLLAFWKAEIERVKWISQSRYDEVAAELKAVETEYKDTCKRLQRQAPKVLADWE